MKSGKNDANDADAICEAASRPSMRFVSLKTAERQAGQALHRVRSRRVKARTARVNEIRGLLAEFGVLATVKGVAACRRLLADALEDAENGLPGLMRALLSQLSVELAEHDTHIAELDAQIQAQCREDERISLKGDKKRLMEIEGIGPISASAVVAAKINWARSPNGAILIQVPYGSIVHERWSTPARIKPSARAGGDKH